MDKHFSFFTPPKDIKKRILELRQKPASHWENKGAEMKQQLVDFAKMHVPAYVKFIREKKEREPITSKDEYLKKFPYPSLFPNGKLPMQGTIALTSGTTGKPFYFPRLPEHDAQYSYTAEILLRTQYAIQDKKTLGLVCFGLGAWIGGIFTYKNFTDLAEKGKLPLTLLPIGPSIESTIATIKDIGGEYEQILLMGYPPFIKDVLDKGVEEGINWKTYNLKIMLAAEGITEGFRKHITRTGKLRNPYSDISNIYGTVELGTMAYEGGLTYLIRELIALHPSLQQDLIGEKGRMPTIAQYHPYLTHFEELNGELFGTGYGSAIPLVRYRFPDKGGVISFSQMIAKFNQHGIDLLRLAKEKGLSESILHLPFVFVFERPNNTITFRGANIYADQIKDVIDRTHYSHLFTGRFSIEKNETRLLKQKWIIHLELMNGVKPLKTDAAMVSKEVVAHLLKINTEFLDQYNSKRTGIAPVVKLYSHADKRFFSRIGKQPWVSQVKSRK